MTAVLSLSSDDCQSAKLNTRALNEFGAVQCNGAQQSRADEVSGPKFVIDLVSPRFAICAGSRNCQDPLRRRRPPAAAPPRPPTGVDDTLQRKGNNNFGLVVALLSPFIMFRSFFSIQVVAWAAKTFLTVFFYV